MIRLNASTASSGATQLLNELRLPLNSWPAKNVAANFRFRIEPALFPISQTKSPKHSAPLFWNFVLNHEERVVLRNCWFHHNPVPPL
jgi:hypothetical protein